MRERERERERKGKLVMKGMKCMKIVLWLNVNIGERRKVFC